AGGGGGGAEAAPERLQDLPQLPARGRRTGLRLVPAPPPVREALPPGRDLLLPVPVQGDPPPRARGAVRRDPGAPGRAPYDRVRLSALLAEGGDPERLRLWPDAWYEDHRVALRPGVSV